MKSTGSSFEHFIRDEHTTLVPVSDRIFSTSVDLTYDFSPIKIPTFGTPASFVVPLQEGEEGYAGSVWDDRVPDRVRAATLETFASDESASVQVREKKTQSFSPIF